ncbi:SMP-30/gluconolactonase/LRE family protein [Rhodococcoides yunnanense]|uniref:SMP-30/gluconolactonase/LRE family protein n=1 Tax=Rhodococcoides yunnanense TaxID=278209 RepID=UPI000933A4B4|nr:SMP-30/gluconolactonase/LRE family protein [Rhodococcus yunnanensis]
MKARATTVAIIVASAVMTSAVMTSAVAMGAPSASADSVCSPWTLGTVASGFGTLENLAFDDRGSLLLSETSLLGTGSIRSLQPDGTSGVVVPDVTSPGGLVTDGDLLYFTTGNGTAAGLFDLHDGTVDTVDVLAGERSTVARGLVMPNGLVALGNGDLVVTRNLGATTGITRIHAGEPDSAETVRTDLGTANGIASDGDAVYVANTFEPALSIAVLDARNLAGDARRIPVDGFGPFTASDDMTVGPDGQIYLAQNLAGRVLRIDPESGSSCVIGTGMPLTTSVEFGGPGWDRNSLYATSFDGTVRQLTPP